MAVRLRCWAGLAVVSCLAVVVVGCGAEESLRVVPGVDGAVVVVAPPVESSGEAIVAGAVALTAGGCVGLGYDSGEGTKVELAIWPAGTEPLEDEVGVDVPGLGRFAVGDQVSTSGGYGGPPGFRGVMAIPQECLTPQIAYPSGE
jgi:hypothetical protein